MLQAERLLECVRQSFSSVITSVLAISVLMACGPAVHVPARNGVAGTEAHKEANDEVQPTVKNDKVQQSEMLADEGEKLLVPKSLSAAAGKFAEAIQLNPENARAQFWAASLKPLLQYKGLATRVKPLFMKSPNGAERWVKMMEGMSAEDPLEMAAFLRDGPEDIQSSDDLLEWADRFSLSLSDLRKTLRTLKQGPEFTINPPSDFGLSETVKHAGYQPRDGKCADLTFGPLRIPSTDSSCEFGGRTSVGVNRADLDAIMAGAAGYQLFVEFWTAYRIDPMSLFVPLQAEVNSTQDGRDVLKAISKPGGQLRRPTIFTDTREITSDVISAMRYMLQNQRDLCPTGFSSSENRRGYLFMFGSCVSFDGNKREPVEVRTLRTIEMLFAGHAIDVPIKTYEGSISNGAYVPRVRTTYIGIKPFNFLQQPPQNIRDFVKPGACGDELNATIFSSVFANEADFEKFIKNLSAGSDQKKTCDARTGGKQ